MNSISSNFLGEWTSNTKVSTTDQISSYVSSYVDEKVGTIEEILSILNDVGINNF